MPPGSCAASAASAGPVVTRCQRHACWRTNSAGGRQRGFRDWLGASSYQHSGCLRRYAPLIADLRRLATKERDAVDFLDSAERAVNGDASAKFIGLLSSYRQGRSCSFFTRAKTFRLRRSVSGDRESGVWCRKSVARRSAAGLLGSRSPRGRRFAPGRNRAYVSPVRLLSESFSRPPLLHAN